MMLPKPLPDEEGVGTADVTSVALAVGAGMIALVIPEIMPPKPLEEVVGTAEGTLEFASVAAEDTAAEVASVALAVGAGIIALVIPEIMPPKPPEEVVGTAEGTLEFASVAAEDTAAEVASVALAVGAGIIALVIPEIMPPKPPEEVVGTAEGTLEFASVAAEDTAAEVASVALAVGEGRMALVIPEMIPPKPPVEVAVGTAEDTPELASVAAEVASLAAEEGAGVASVALAVEEGRMALVMSEMIPPRSPDVVVVGTAEDTSEVTSVAAEETAEVKSVTAEEAAEVASVALVVGAGKTALVTSETASPKSLVNPPNRPPPDELAAGALEEVGVTIPVGAITIALEAAFVGLAALDEPAAADEPLLADETADSAALVDVLDPRPIPNKPLDGKSSRGEDPAAEDPAALDSVFPVGIGVVTTPVIVVEGDTNTGVVRVIVWLSLSPEFDPELEGSFFDDPKPFDKLAMRSPRLSDESRFAVSDVPEVVLSGVDAAEGALVMVMLVNCRFTCRGK
ncbi:hypothetical protein PG994_013236 [Apiospora phragmitis]|uniref:Uncharacterized protein n=1 Tax=Apiospora phragmitis TaxID=2905665 RepID=A0ABR1TAM3_9PEZI